MIVVEVVVRGIVLLCITMWLGFDRWRPVAVLQSLAPYLCLLGLPIGVVAAAAGDWPAVVESLVALGTLAWIVVPAVRERRPAGLGTGTTVCFGNLLAWNREVGRLADALCGTGADVLALTECTPEMAIELDRRCGDRYPHRLEELRPDPSGIAIWSTRPFTGAVVPLGGRPALSAEVDGIRLLVVHTEPPTMRARQWSDELTEIGRRADDLGLDVVIGDFNAARWHPSFRRLLRRGWRGAHEWLGQWHSRSWANEGRMWPLFVRIDHALVRDGGRVAPAAVQEVALPGSDHRAFVVTLTTIPTRP